MLQPRKHPRRAQVGEQAEVLSEAKDRLFRAQMAFECIARRIAHRAEQDRIGRARSLQGGFRQRVAMAVIGRPADIGTGQRQAWQVQRLKHRHRLRRYLRADPVTGQDCNLHYHPMR